MSPRTSTTPREEQDELVRRLRALEWPTPAAEVRERCLRDFERRLSQLQEHGLDEAPPERYH